MTMLKMAAVLAVSVTLAACHTTGGETGADKTASTYHHHHGKHGQSSFSAFTDKFFAMMDRNDDGTVTRAERAAAPHQEMMLPFEQVDKDGNGLLTLDEYREVVFDLHHKPKSKPVEA